MLNLQTVIMNYRREFWEYRRWLVGLPLAISALMLLASITMVIMADYSSRSDHKSDEVTGFTFNLGDDDEQEDESVSGGEDSALNNSANAETSDEEFWYMGAYFMFVWLAALFYLINSLYSDRRDKSILYWKSLPVSETETVASKYLFAVTAFIFVATLIALMNAILLYTLFHFGLEPKLDHQPADVGFNIMQLFVWPILVIAISGIWCAPWFAWAMFVSAFSKRFPILLFVLAPFGVTMVEGLVFRTSFLSTFASTHSPWELLARISSNPSLGDFINQHLLSNAASFMVAIIVSTVLLYGAVWYRTHRFET